MKPAVPAGESVSCSRKVILLLDLDCFYAQCEAVRLGLDPALPVALLQWNSALAVNYPARALGIKRGDSFDEIASKGEGKCTALHLPVMTAANCSSTATCDSTATKEKGIEEDEIYAEECDGKTSLEEAYNVEYRLSKTVREAEFQRERNRRRFPSEGKASLERYRLASSRIFSIIMETLCVNIGRKNFILERASIDEMFIDVSNFCYDFSSPCWSEAPTPESSTSQTLSVDISRKETTICGSESAMDLDFDYDEAKAIWRGCTIAKGVRKAVFESIGFTLSAGVSTSKLVAKLAAAYGKPNGQAVIFPFAVEKVMEDTQIKKVRNLGGKLGKKVRSLLPPDNEQTMGSIARLLSLNELSKALGDENGRMVFNACRGVDDEPVKETTGALTKSITAFKSFQRTDFEGSKKWINLLAEDVIVRVEQDTKRNSRYPKGCSIQYVSSAIGSSEWIARSIRIPFPKESERATRKEELISSICSTLQSKGQFPIRRLGVSAIDFETRAKNGIKSFFAKGGGVDHDCKKGKTPQVMDQPHHKSPLLVIPNTAKQDEKLARSLQEKFNIEGSLFSPTMLPLSNTGIGKTTPTVRKGLCPFPRTDLPVIDADLAYAQKLQSSFDRENFVLSSAEKNKPVCSKKPQGKLSRKGNDSRSLPSKKQKINDFFSVKKT